MTSPSAERSRHEEGRGVGGEAEVLEDPAHDLAVGDESDELALAAAPGAGEDVDLEDALQELGTWVLSTSPLPLAEGEPIEVVVREDERIVVRDLFVRE